MTMLNMLEMERYIAASAKRADLKVVWHDDEVASTDGKHINLPRMNEHTTLEDYKKLVHYVTHEVDHVLYSDFKKLSDTNVHAKNSLMGAIWNLLEDHRIEYLGDAQFEGDRRINDEVESHALKAIADKMKAAPEHEIVQQLAPLLKWNAEVKADFHPSLFSLEQDLTKAVPSEAQPLLNKLLAGDYGDALRNVRQIEDPVKGTAATYELSKRIFKEVFGQDPEAEEKRCQEEKQQQKQKGKSKTNANAEGSESEDKQDGQEGEGGKQDKDAEGKGKKEKQKGKPNYGLYLDDDHSSKAGNPRRDLKLDYSKYTHTHKYTPATVNDYKVHDHTKETLRPDATWDRAIKHALTHTSPQFAARVRTLLQIRSRDRYQYGTKKGKLHGSALHRIMVPDAPGYADHLFKRKIETNILNSAVSLVIDQSGSMSGDKYAHAAAAAAMLSDTIGNVLHIPVEVVSFTDYDLASNGSLCHMHIHRKFDDKRVAQDVLVSRMSTSAQLMSSNADGDAIMWAFDRLIKRKEPRKLMVVFSDGSPAGGGRGDINWYTKQVVENIQTKSPVQIYGIGICDASVERFYKEHTVINSASELERTLLTLIERKLV